MKVLLKSLKFTPIPRRNDIKTKCFANKNDITFDDQNPTVMKDKGIFHSPRNRN